MARPDRRPILVADDEPEIRDLLEEYLRASGYDVVTAANGLEALWAVKHTSPGLVLLDLAMPRLGGLEAIKHIQKFDPSIRIVVVTGQLTRDAAVKLRDLGIPIVPKPLDLEVLRELIA
ncbi:MAG: response regulator [Candidatus Rokubacteria bacterium]|nr:response regulator [Candidatus Rokubacteria bacterium]